MHTTLWIVAGLMAFAFAVGGISKLALPREKIAELPGGRWVSGFSDDAVSSLGVVDLAAAAGLVLPAVLDVAPILVPIAAVGVMLLMAGAVAVRLRHGSAKAIPGDLTYFALAAFVAWGRFVAEPF